MYILRETCFYQTQNDVQFIFIQAYVELTLTHIDWFSLQIQSPWTFTQPAWIRPLSQSKNKLRGAEANTQGISCGFVCFIETLSLPFLMKRTRKPAIVQMRPAARGWYFKLLNEGYWGFMAHEDDTEHVLHVIQRNKEMLYNRPLTRNDKLHWQTDRSLL